MKRNISRAVTFILAAAFILSSMNFFASADEPALVVGRVQLDIVPSSTTIATGSATQSIIGTLTFSGAEDTWIVSGASVKLYLKKPLNLCSNGLVMTNYITGSSVAEVGDYNVVTINFITFNGNDTEVFRDGAGKIPFQVLVSFPNLITDNDISSDVYAEFWQNGVNLSAPQEGPVIVPRAPTPEAPIYIVSSAGSGWLSHIYLCSVGATSSASVFGDYNAYRLTGMAPTYTPESTINYLMEFKNQKLNTDGPKEGTISTSRLDFSQSFKLPAGTNLSANNIEVTDLSGASDVSMTITDTSVTSDGTVTIAGYWTNSAATTKDMPNLTARVNLKGITVSSASATVPNGWTLNEDTISASFDNTLTSSYQTFLSSTPTSIDGNSVTAALYYGSTAPSGGGSENWQPTLRKVINRNNDVIRQAQTWPTDRFKDFGLDNFGNTSDKTLTDFTITDTFDSDYMVPVRISSGNYLGADGNPYPFPSDKFKIKLTLKNNTERIYSVSPGTTPITFSYDTHALQDPGGPSNFTADDVASITYMFGDVAPGFKIKPGDGMRPSITFQTKDLSDSSLTIQNSATLTCKYLNLEKSVSSSVSYQYLNSGQPYLSNNKSAVNDLDNSQIFENGRFVYYTIATKNSSTVTVYNPTIVDTMPFINGTQLFEAGSYQRMSVLKGMYTDTSPSTFAFPIAASRPNLGNWVDVSAGGGVWTFTDTRPSFDPNTQANAKATFAFQPGTGDFIWSPGETILIRYKVKIDANVPANTTLINSYDVLVNKLNGPGIGVGGDGGNAWTSSGSCTISTSAVAPRLAVAKLADKTNNGATPRAYAPPLLTANDNAYYDAFSSSVLPDAYLPNYHQGWNNDSNLNKQPPYPTLTDNSAPFYSEADGSATFTLFIKNDNVNGTSVDMPRLAVRDVMSINTGFANVNGDIYNYFKYDSAKNSYAMEPGSVKIMVFGGDRKFKYAFDTANLSDTNSPIIYRASTDSFPSKNYGILTWYIDFTKTPLGSFKQGDQVQIQYSLPIKDEIVYKAGIVKFVNSMEAAYWDGASTSYMPAGYRFNYLVDADKRFASSFFASGWPHINNVLSNDMTFYMKPDDTTAGLEKTVINSTQSLRVDDVIRNTYLRTGTASGNQGATYTYKIRVYNNGTVDIPKSTLKLFDLLPPGQKIVNKNGTVPSLPADAQLFSDAACTAPMTGYVSDLSVVDGRQLVSFTNFAPVPVNNYGETFKDFYIKAIVTDVPASILALGNAYSASYKNEIAMQLVDSANGINFAKQNWFTHGSYADSFAGMIAVGGYITDYDRVGYYRDMIRPDIAKTSDKPISIIPGASITYTINITNNSSLVDMTGFKVTDLQDSHIGRGSLPAFTATFTPSGGSPQPVTGLISISDPVLLSDPQNSNKYWKFTWDVPTSSGISLKKGDLLQISYTATAGNTSGHWKNHAFLIPSQPFASTGAVTGAYLDKSNLSALAQEYTYLTTLAESAMDAAILGNYDGPNKKGSMLWSVVQNSISSIPGLEPSKGIRRADDPAGTPYKMNDGSGVYITQLPGKSVQYQLKLVNTGADTYNRIRILDVLPHIGDTGIYVQADLRESQFPLTLDNAGDLSDYNITVSKQVGAGAPVPLHDWTVTFGKDITTRMAVAAGGAPTSTDAWKINGAYEEGDNALLLNLGNTSLAHLDSLIVTFTAKLPAPPIITDPASADLSLNRKIAWNTFAARVNVGSLTSDRDIEPLRVGVKAVTGSVTIHKSFTAASYTPSPAGFQFGIYDPADTGFTSPLATSTTNISGNAYFGNLIPGETYKIKEITQSDYQFSDWSTTDTTGAVDIDAGIASVTIPTATANDTVYDFELTATNITPQARPVTGSITVFKTFDTSVSAETTRGGYEFTLYAPEGTGYSESDKIVFSTSAGSGADAGKVVFSNLAPGKKYKLVESNSQKLVFKRWVIPSDMESLMQLDAADSSIVYITLPAAASEDLNLSIDAENQAREYDSALRKWISKVERYSEAGGWRTVSGIDYSEPAGGAATPAVPLIKGDRVTFSIKVFNQCAYPLQIPRIVDYLPAGYNFIQYDSSSFPYNQNWFAGTGNVSGNKTGNIYYMPPNPIFLNANTSSSDPKTYADGTTSVVELVTVVSSAAAPGNLGNAAEIFELHDSDGLPVPDIDSTPDDDNTNDKVRDNEINDNGTNDEDDHDIAVGKLVQFDLSIQKSFSDQSRDKSGFEFALYNNSDRTSPISKVTTSTTGLVNFQNLTPGVTYAISETNRSGFAFDSWIIPTGVTGAEVDKTNNAWLLVTIPVPYTNISDVTVSVTAKNNVAGRSGVDDPPITPTVTTIPSTPPSTAPSPAPSPSPGSPRPYAPPTNNPPSTPIYSPPPSPPPVEPGPSRDVPSPPITQERYYDFPQNIPLGYHAVTHIDENGDVYWTIEPDDTPLSITLPIASGIPFGIGIFFLGGALLINGVLLSRKRKH